MKIYIIQGLLDHPPKELRARVGTSYREYAGLLLDVMKAYWRSCFAPLPSEDCDLGMIEIEEQYYFPDVVRFVKLPKPNERTLVNENLKVTGWGKTSSGSHSVAYLRAVDVPVIDRESCKAIYKPLKIEITDRMFCAGVADGKL